LLPDAEAFPEAARWLPKLLQSIGDFTGQGDEFDDPVDALGNAHRLLTLKNQQTEDDSDNAWRPGVGRKPERADI
jgi:hypothetical protein